MWVSKNLWGLSAIFRTSCVLCGVCHQSCWQCPARFPPCLLCSRSVQSTSLGFFAYHPAPRENRGPLWADTGLSCSLLYWGAVSLVVSPWPFVPLPSTWAILPTSRCQNHLLKRFSHFPGRQNHLELVSTQLWRPIPINSHSLGLGAPRFLLYPLTTLMPPSHHTHLKPRNVNVQHLWVEKAMAIHSSTLAWKIPWMEEPGGL